MKDPQSLTVKVANESKYMQKCVWPKINRYFDKCEEYVDISVHIVDIEAGGGGNTNLITRTYVELADGTIVYGAPVMNNYNAVRGQ